MNIITDTDVTPDMIIMPFQNKTTYHEGHTYLIEQAKLLSAPLCVKIWIPHWDWIEIVNGTPHKYDDVPDVVSATSWFESQGVDHLIVSDLSDFDSNTNNERVLSVFSKVDGADADAIRQAAKDIMVQDELLHWRNTVNLSLECHLMCAISGISPYKKFFESDKDGWHSLIKKYIWETYGDAEFTITPHLQDQYGLPYSTNLKDTKKKDKEKFKFKKDKTFTKNKLFKGKIDEMLWQDSDGKIHRISRMGD